MKTTIDFNDLNLKTKKYKNRILQIIKKIIDSGQFLNGKQNQKLIENLKSHLGSGYVTTVASGHDAILLALQLFDLKPEDEVIFPVNSYPTAFPVALTKAKLIPCDVDRNGLIDVNEIAKKINKNTKAIILVHLYGLVVNVDEINKLVKGKNIILIEDCAQAFGAKYNNKQVGSLCDIGCFSFYPTKNLGTLGDGGSIWIKNKKQYEYFLKAKSYGESKKYFSEFIAGHSRLPEIQAGILNVYFKNIKQDFNKKIILAKYWKEKIEKSGLTKYVRVLKSVINSVPVQHLFVVNVKNRDKIKKYLQKHNIKTHVHFPTPVHLLPAFSFLNKKIGDFPQAERLSKNILSLPFHQYLTKKQIDYIVVTIHKFYCG